MLLLCSLPGYFTTVFKVMEIQYHRVQPHGEREYSLRCLLRPEVDGGETIPEKYNSNSSSNIFFREKIYEMLLITVVFKVILYFFVIYVIFSV